MNLKNKTHKSERATAIQRAPQVAVNSPEHERSLNPVAALQRATGAHPSALRPADIMTLQRTVGNRAVQRMLSNRPRSLSSPPSTSAQIIQRQTEEEEPIQAKSEISARSQNRTGLPDRLKTGIENLSGLSLDDVRVHRNSSRPAELQARAFTQGTDIHVGPDEEQHLPHEAWHVVQQKQGRVRPTLQLRRVAINDDAGLEKEADVMGVKALTLSRPDPSAARSATPATKTVPGHTAVQRKIGFEFEVGGIKTEHTTGDGNWVSHGKGDVITDEPGYKITADISAHDSQLEFVTDQFDETKDSEVAKIARVADFIRGDMEDIVAQANARRGVVLASDVRMITGGANDRFRPQLKDYLNLAGQLQMTGGVSVRALARVVSGSGMPDRTAGGPGTRYQDYALYYKDVTPTGGLKQPIYRAAGDAVNGFVGQADPKRGGLPGWVRGALAAVVTLMAQIPLNMRGALGAVQDQGLFLARTDYAKILKMIGDDSGIDIDPDGFAQALLSTINQFADPRLRLSDDVFPASYSSAGQQLTGVSIGEWARSVVPTPGKWFGRWQGADLITKKNFPGTQAQKAELRAFGGFGNQTDPGNKLILEWRNLQTMYADQLVLVMTGLAEYLRHANR